MSLEVSIVVIAGTSPSFRSLPCGSRLCRVTHRKVIDTIRQQALCFLLCSQEALVHAGLEESPPTSLCSYFKGIIENPQ